MRSNRASFKKAHKLHSVLVAVFAVYLLLVSITSVYAARLINYTYDSSEVIEDEFVPVYVSCSVKDAGKDKYTITNDSSTPVYLRFSPVSQWVNLENGRFFWQAPTCTVSGLTASEWMLGADGFYYRVLPLAAGASVTVTITHAVNNAPPNHEFKVNLVAEVIQSEPITAMQEAWKVNLVPNVGGNQGGLEVEGSDDDPQQGMGGTK